MTQDEVGKFITSNVSVTRQKVTIAKAYVLDNFLAKTEDLINSFLTSKSATMPEQIVLHATVEPGPILKQAVDSVSWRFAICEAIWALIGQAVIFPDGSQTNLQEARLGYTTVVKSSGGTSGGVDLPNLYMQVPDKLLLSRSSASKEYQPLTCPDLYLGEVDISDLNPEIETALREAVLCFRHELFTASLAMLGRASEVAWIQLGLALSHAASSATSFNADKKKRDLEDPYVGIARKIGIVLEIYSNSDFESLRKETGIRRQDIKNITIWADCVREGRNSLHYNAEPSMSNCYEKVAALLIAAVPHLRLLVALRAAADNAARARLS